VSESESVRALPRMLTGGNDFERYTFAGACNEPVPNNWKNACRRVAGHGGKHHSWDPRTGTDKGRHPLPFSDDEGHPIPAVDAWPGRPYDVRMLRGHGAYVAPVTTDRLMVEAIRRREVPVYAPVGDPARRGEDEVTAR
jgi:hypothetical protein